jgi:hypothetical protein
VKAKRPTCSKLSETYYRAVQLAFADGNLVDKRYHLKGKLEEISEVHEVDGDENGYFKFDAVPPDFYRILAIGQAGSYPTVVWDGVASVDSGRETTATISSIYLACR